MERIIRYSTPAHPEDHQPGHCDCNCFGKGFTIRYNDVIGRPTAFGRKVAHDDKNVYIDWYETYGKGGEPENWHADPWPLELYTEVVLER